MGGHGSAEVGMQSLGRGGKDIQPLTQSWHYDHIGRNTELCTLIATVSGCVPRSVAREEGHASGWPGWLPHPAAF